MAAILLSAWLGPMPVMAQAPASAPAGDPQSVTNLRAALQTNDGTRLQQVVADPTSALAGWIDERLHDHLMGIAAIQSWEVSLTPLFDSARDIGTLHVAAHLASGKTVEAAGPVRLLGGGRLQPLASIGDLSLPIVGHTLQVKLDPVAATLEATDTIACKPQTGRSYLLRLSPQVAVATLTMGGKALPFERQADRMVVSVPAGTPAGPLVVRYGGVWTPGPYDFINPQSVLLRPESDWYPQGLGPANPMTFSTTVQVAGLMPQVTGVRAGNGPWKPVRPVNGVAVAAGKYVSKTRKVGKVDVQVWVTADSAVYADTVLNDVAKVLTFAQAKLGPYPFTTLTVAESAVAGGYGGEGFISLGSRVLANDHTRSTFIAHEVFHSWTDRLLARGTEGEIGFLSEALTTYLAYQYVSSLPESDAAQLRAAMTQDYGRYHGQTGDVAVRDARAATGTGPWFGVVYQKGAMVLHDLYRHLGERRFWAVVKSLYGGFNGKPVGLADVRAVAEKVAEEPLGWWFAQWTQRAGAPQLALQDVTMETLEGGRYRVSGKVSQSGGTYRLKLPLAVRTASGVEQFDLSLLRDEQPFAVIVPTEPKDVLLDPEYQILSTASDRQSVPVAVESAPAPLLSEQ